MIKVKLTNVHLSNNDPRVQKIDESNVEDLMLDMTQQGLDDDAELEKIYDKIYDLSEFTAADQFKSYDELKSRLDSVLARKAVVTPKMDTEDLEDLSEGLTPTPEPVATVEETTEEEDDALSYFQKLAEE